MCLRNLLMSPYDPLSMAPKLPIDARPAEDQSGHSVRNPDIVPQIIGYKNL